MTPHTHSTPDCRRWLDARRAEFDHAHRTVREERTRLAAAEQHLEDVLAAQRVVQAVAVGLQETAHAQVAQVATKCLQTVFADPYELRVVFEQKRGKTEARLTFFKDGKEHDPEEETEGGVIDVAAFGLRVAKVLLQKPPVRRVLFLDEPFRMLDPRNAPRVRVLLETLAVDLSLQIVQVTHNPALVAGRVVELD